MSLLERLAVATAVLLATMLSAAAETIEERLAVCSACHGEVGHSSETQVPSLGAQPAPYVLIQLYLFREKQRRIEPMTQAAQGLTDDQLRQIADFVSKLPAPKPPTDPLDAVRIERARSLAHKNHCGFCHNADFSGHDNVPRLAGQHEAYLLKALREYKSNTRPGYDATMAEVVQPISDADLADLAYLMAHAQ